MFVTNDIILGGRVFRAGIFKNKKQETVFKGNFSVKYNAKKLFDRTTNIVTICTKNIELAEQLFDAREEYKNIKIKGKIKVLDFKTGCNVLLVDKILK